MTKRTNFAVNEAVGEAMHVDWFCAVDRAVRMGVYWAMYDAVRVDNAVRGAVDGAVYNSVDWGVNKAVRLIMDWDVNDAVDNALYRTVPWVVRDVIHWAVHWVVDDKSPHPGLQDFLLRTEVEA
jgi:hypothetical protein